MKSFVLSPVVPVVLGLFVNLLAAPSPVVLGLVVLHRVVLGLAVLDLAVLRLVVLGLAVLGLAVLGLAALGPVVLGPVVLDLVVLNLAFFHPAADLVLFCAVYFAALNLVKTILSLAYLYYQ